MIRPYHHPLRRDSRPADTVGHSFTHRKAVVPSSMRADVIGCTQAPSQPKELHACMCIVVLTSGAWMMTEQNSPTLLLTPTQLHFYVFCWPFHKPSSSLSCRLDTANFVSSVFAIPLCPVIVSARAVASFPRIAASVSLQDCGYTLRINKSDAQVWHDNILNPF